MDNNCSAHSFLCGYFSCNDLEARLVSGSRGIGEGGWVRQVLSEQEYSRLCNIYYESYVDSLVEKSEASSRRKDIYSSTAHYVLTADCQCVLRSQEIYREFKRNGALVKEFPLPGDFSFTVSRIHLYGFPYGIVLFAIELDESSVSFDLLTAAHQELRNVNSYKKWVARGAAAEYLAAIAPLVEVVKDKDSDVMPYGRLVETGGKLKLFQIIKTKEVDDALLYELGCLFKPGIVKEGTDKTCPSDSYYASVIDNNTLHVFKNWKVLALFDTFTVLGDVGFFQWSLYFRMIYIHALYQKRLLFDLNQRFRMPSQARGMGKLVNEMMERERYYSFPTISYNFLPQMIYEKACHGLDLESERTQLHKYVEQEGRRMETIAEKRTSRMLFALTLLAVASAMYDLTGLVTSVLGYEPASCSYNLVSLIVVAVVLVVMISILVYNKCRKI